MDAKLLSYVLRAKNRREVLILISKERLTPSQITKRCGMYESHTSRTLKELSDKRLIVCENPDERRFRFYSITKQGKLVAAEVKKVLLGIKQEKNIK